MQTVVHGERVSPHYLVHAGTAEPLRVSPPEAVAYLLELLAYFHHVAVSHKKRLFSAGCNAPPVASPESGARRTDHRKRYISARLSNRSQSRLRVRLVRSFSPHCGHW